MAPESANTQNSRLEISWETYDRDVRKLAEGIKALRPGLTHIYGIPRGGSVMAVHLSHLTGLEYAPTKIGLTPYNTLIVDDVSDTGVTLVPYRKSGWAIATLHMKPGTKVVPDLWVTEVPRHVWIVYPYEH